MTAQPAPYFTEGVSGGSDTLTELSRVRLLRAVDGDDGIQVPAGSVGTIVAVWGRGKGYDVEFTSPLAALVSVDPRDLEAIRT